MCQNVYHNRRCFSMTRCVSCVGVTLTVDAGYHYAITFEFCFLFGMNGLDFLFFQPSFNFRTTQDKMTLFTNGSIQLISTGKQCRMIWIVIYFGFDNPHIEPLVFTSFFVAIFREEEGIWVFSVTNMLCRSQKNDFRTHIRLEFWVFFNDPPVNPGASIVG